MKNKILKLREKMSLYEIAIEIGISETTLYSYINDYKKVSRKSIGKIERYFKRRENNENITCYE